ncbi:MAG: TonB-dependent receptor [Candidatus Omnitrophica bacterium]|nr:TonB-dependent receptor [Candidatus Omnitrophota bacterium]
MMRKVIGLAIILSFVAAPSVSFAKEEGGSSAVNLGTILVSEEERSWGTQDVRTIDSGEIDRTRESRTADGLLGNIAGIDLKRTSYGGNTGSEVILRGFDESRYLVLLDGRPLNGAGVYGGNYVDWASLSTEDIERVEIVRGTESVEYGNTLGGTINIITKKSTGKTKIDIRSSYGSYNTVDAAVSQSGRLGEMFYENLSYGYWRTDGYLRNNHNNRNNFAGRLNIALPGGINAGVGARYTVQERGFIVENYEGAAYYNNAYPESREDSGGGPYPQWWGKPGPFGPVRPKMYWGDGSYWKDRRGQYDLTLEKTSGSLDIKAHAYMNKEERKEYYYAIDNSSKLVLMRYSEPEDSLGWFVKAVQTAGKHTIRYGFEGKYLGYGGQEIPYADRSYFRVQPAPSDGAPDASRLNSAFAQGTWFISPSLDLNVGLRYDHYLSKQPSEIERQGLSPKIGLVYRLWKDIKLEADLGQAYRFPTCPESYWYFAGYQPPDRKSLLPERAIQGEIGLSKEFADKGKIGARGYYYYVYDYIRTIFGYRPSRVVYNIDTVMLSGMEVEGEYSIIKDLTVFANYTYQTTTKDGDVLDKSSALSDNLTELPENKVNAGLRHLYRGLTTEFVMRYVDKRQELTGSALGPDASSLSALAKFATFDLNFTYKMLDRKNCTGTVEFKIGNLFDARYEETSGFPMPGRTVTGGVNVRF